SVSRRAAARSVSPRLTSSTAPTRSVIVRRQARSLVLGGQRVDQLVERLAVEDAIELVQRQVDSVVGYPALREVVGADALGPVAGADLALSGRSTLRLGLLALVVVEPGEQDPHRLGTVLVL